MSTTISRQPKSRANRRKRRFIRPDIQVKIILCIFCSVFTAMLFNLQIHLLALYHSNSIFEPILSVLFKMLLSGFGFSLLLALPISIWAGIVISFHFCGPLYRIKLHLQQLLTGRWDLTCTLRKKDDLKDVSKALNEFVSSSNMFHQQQHRLLKESLILLDQAENGAVDSEKLKQLRSSMEDASAEYENRLGEQEAEEAIPEASTEQQEKQPA